MFNDELFKRINFINMSEGSIEAYNSFLKKVLIGQDSIVKNLTDKAYLEKCFKMPSYEKGLE
jgi:hypothetical protein